MDLKLLQEQLVEHIKTKDELVERLTDIQNKVQSLTAEHQMLVQEGQLVEGGIALLNKMIEDEKAEHDVIDAEIITDVTN